MPVESGNRLRTGIGRWTQLGSIPSTRAVTPSMTSAVLPTSTSMTVTPPGLTATSSGLSSVRTSDPHPALDRHHDRLGGFGLDHDLVAGGGGDHEPPGQVHLRRPAWRHHGRPDRRGIGDLAGDAA